MLKITRVLAVASLVVFIGVHANLASGGMFDSIKAAVPGGGSQGSSGASVSRGDIDALYKTVSVAEMLLQKSIDIAFNMLANKDEIDKMEQRQKEIENIKDPKEKEAEMKKIEEDKMVAVEKSIDQQETADKVQKLDEKNKQLLVKAIYNIFLAGLRDTSAVNQAKDLSQKIKSNPKASVSFANDLPKVGGIISTLPSQAQKVCTLGSNLSKLAQDNKIECTLPKTAAEQPKEVEI